MLTKNAAGGPISAAFLAEITAVENTPVWKVYVNWSRAANWNPVPGGTSTGLGAHDDISDYIDSEGGVSIERNLTTDVPAGVRLVTGAAVANMTLTLTGDDTTPGNILWSPYASAAQSPYSPAVVDRIEAPIRAFMGFKLGDGSLTDFVPQFTGYIRSLKLTGSTGTAELQALDPSDQMRNAVNYPAIANGLVEYTNTVTGFTNPSYNQFPGLDGHFAIDYALRQNGYFQSPPQHSAALLAVPFKGSAWPLTKSPNANITWTEAWETNNGANAYNTPVGPPSFELGVMGERMRPHRGNMFTGSYFPGVQSADDWNQQGPTWAPGSSFKGMQFEMQLTTPAAWPGLRTNQGVADEYWTEGSNNWFDALFYALFSAQGSLPALELRIMADGTIQSVMWGLSGAPVAINSTLSLPAGGATYYVGAHFSFTDTTHITVTFNVGGTTESITKAFTSGDFPSNTAWWRTAIQMTSHMALSDFQQIRINAPDWSHRTFTPNAYLDASLNALSALPYQKGGFNAWSAMTDIASAELGMVTFDETGIFHFYNRRRFINTAPPSVTFSDVDKLADVVTTESVDQIINHAIISVTPFVVQSGSWVWSTAHTRGVHSQSFEDIPIEFDNPVVGVRNEWGVIPAGGIDPADDTAGNGFRASYSDKGNGYDAGEYVGPGSIADPAILVTGPTTAIVRLQNNGNHPIYFVSARHNIDGEPDYPSASQGKPMIQVRGFEVLPLADAITTDGATESVNTRQQAEQLAAISMSKYGEQLWQPDDNPWRQDIDSAQMLANDVVSQLSYPTPFVGDISVPGDPTVQLGDKGRVTATSVILDTSGYVVGSTLTCNQDDGLDSALTVRAGAPVVGWILGDPSYAGHTSQSILGTTTILAGVQ